MMMAGGLLHIHPYIGWIIVSLLSSNEWTWCYQLVASSGSQWPFNGIINEMLNDRDVIIIEKSIIIILSLSPGISPVVYISFPWTLPYDILRFKFFATTTNWCISASFFMKIGIKIGLFLLMNYRGIFCVTLLLLRKWLLTGSTSVRSKHLSICAVNF
jgi:hypothetical protein